MSLSKEKETTDKVTLPEGWTTKVVNRKGSNRADVYFYSPDNKKIRSRKELERYLSKNIATSETTPPVIVDAPKSGKRRRETPTTTPPEQCVTRQREDSAKRSSVKRDSRSKSSKEADKEEEPKAEEALTETVTGSPPLESEGPKAEAPTAESEGPKAEASTAETEEPKAEGSSNVSDECEGRLINAELSWDPVKRRLWASEFDVGRASLHLSAVPLEVKCREREEEAILQFCQEHVENRKSGSLYICGCPGSGKTVTVKKICGNVTHVLKNKKNVQVVFINCMTLCNPDQIFHKILRELGYSGSERFGRAAALEAVKKTFTGQSGSDKIVLLILDEVDQLITHSQSILVELFLLPSYRQSTCILIGIANAIDLADRFLPHFRALNCLPRIVTFPAYSKDQIHAILQQRLETLTPQLIAPQALELCARKVSAASGDIRKALEISRTAVDVAVAEVDGADLEHSQNDSCLSTLTDSGTAFRDSEKSLPRAIDFPKVTVAHMVQALSSSLRSPTIDTIQALPQHQQMVLCCTLCLFRRSKKDATLGEVNDAYVKMCTETSLRAVSAAEFSGVCTILADQALLVLGASREDRKRRVTLRVSEDDVIFALQGIRFFRGILAKEATL